MFTLLISVLLVGLVGIDGVSSVKRDDTFSFTQPIYDGTVQEKTAFSKVESDVKMGMWLTNVSRGVRFDIVDGENNFQVNERTVGNFVFLELYSQSINRLHEIRIRAISPDRRKQTFCTVRVHVTDLNDFQPLFPQKPYSVSISEDTKVGTTIAYVKATDSDRDPENTRFYYSLPEFTSDYFAVHPVTGAVTLTAQLNARTQADHSVIIQATDRKAALSGTAQPKTTTLTVSVTTVNAHAPVITVHEPLAYDSSQTELPHGRPVYAIITVTDADSGRHGQIAMPRITHSDEFGLFDIEPRGKRNEYQLVFTRSPPPFNGVLNVSIEVSDSGVPSRSSEKIINVKLFDKETLIPVFPGSPFHMVVSEFSPSSTQVGFVSAKVLNSHQPKDIYYSIESGNIDRAFAINPHTALITTIKRLNRNVRRDYRLKVAAFNSRIVDGKTKSKNTTTVVITIQDANDNDPLFDEDSYTTSLAEDAPVGTKVIRVHATDEDSGINGTVVYKLIDNAGLPFRIDPFNGAVFTTGPLDRDTMSSNKYTLRVRASDGGLPFSRKSECFVTVNLLNVNDNPPLFNEVDCIVAVPHSIAVDNTVIRLEPIDIDRNRVTCSMLSGGNGLFEVDPETCEIRLSSPLSVGLVGDQTSLQVVATDGVHTSEPVVVNVTITSSGSISKNCRDTGAIRRLDDLMNHLLANNLRDGKVRSVNVNRTSELPNNYGPRITAPTSLLGIKVSEDAPLGSVVARVRAEDRDRGFNGKLWFTITSGNEDSCFTINTMTGLITLMQPLDREHKPVHNLTVSVSDYGTPVRASVVRVTFVLTDVNDNFPVFDRNNYLFELAEDVHVGYIIQNNVEATDADEGLNAQIRYTFATQTPGDVFSINPLTGFITVTGRLDRETTSEYNLAVVASDSSTTHPLTSTTNVAIRLLDVNDNAPQFYRPVHRIRVSEDLPLHALVFWLEARDPDFGVNGAVRYTLTDGISNRNDARQRFRVDHRTGAIRLSAKLDARLQSRYNITARARDVKKLYSTCFLEVEVLPVNRNLHAPYFEDRVMHLNVSEDAAVGTEISTVSAIDDDITDQERDIGYSIVDGTGLGIFSIDENTGTITTTRKLDRETEQYYWLTVVAKDRAPVPLSGRMFVLVEVTDVNDNAPFASQSIYFASVAENSPMNSLVTTIHATDHDSGTGGTISFSMAKNRYFKIDSSTGAIQTIKRRLDRESANATQLTFDVTISDAGTPPLSSSTTVVVKIVDENDNSPKFMSGIDTKLSLPKMNRSRTVVPIARVVALDRDGGRNADIDYLLDNSRKFSINPKTGVISTEHTFREGLHSVIKVQAFDLGDPQRHSKVRRVEIEWGPPARWSAFAPVFDEGGDITEMYYEHVDLGFIQDSSQYSGRRFIHMISATDVDSDQIWFFIVDGNDDYMFHINSDGSLFITGEPDAERKSLYNLTVEATDGVNSAFKQVLVYIGDVNDHRPVFTEEVFRASVDENAAPNTRVIKVSATDGDNSPRNRALMYSIRNSVDPSSETKFRITPAGIIYTTMELDRETQQEHVLTVKVDDQGVPGSLQAYCRVIITVTDRNEHPPRFTSPVYHGQAVSGQADGQVGADDTVGAVVLRVQATDRDQGENARIFYSISAGNEDRLWKINPSTGDVSATRRIVAEDGGLMSRSTFTVKATDGGKEPLSSTSEVSIEIRAYDDTPPLFEQDHVTVEVHENIPRNSFITMVTANAPSGITYDVTSGNDDGRFAINPHSGVISLAEALDREEMSTYNLKVTAVSMEGRKSTSRVTVRVNDVNDNRPSFFPSIYAGYVSESHSSSSSSSVTDADDRPLVVRASDADVSDNARVTYKIVDPTEDVRERFTLDASTGAIRTKPGAGLFDYESVKQYQFQVQAVDLGSPRLASKNNALVTVLVKDSNDSVPAFTKSLYNAKLLLPTSDGVIVTKETKAVQQDSFYQRSSDLEYFLSGGNEKSAFEIDPDTGVIRVADASIMRCDDAFTLRLRVTNGRRSAAAVVTVTVTNATRLGLTFSQDVYEASVSENSTEIRALIVASINEMTLDDYIRYSILNPTPGFTIGSTSGTISTTGVPVDREEKNVHKLLIEAVDVHSGVDGNMETVRRGRCMVNVAVTDVNDNAPQFIELPYYATVQVDAKPGTAVKQVRAVDVDEGMNGKVRYGLEGSHSDLFRIDARKGTVTLRRTPDIDVDGGNAKFNITVVAQDMGTSPLAEPANIRVSIVNRATPVFTQPFYGDVSVSEDAKSHTVVTAAVQASSPDTADVLYTIEEGDPFKQFDIDFVGGTITTLGNLDRELTSRYRLRVRARDEQSRAYADVEVEVKVIDVNDNAPVFSKPAYLSRLPETASVGSTVTQVVATDEDADANGRVQYTMVDDDSSDGGNFLVDPHTGVIWTTRELDSEEKSHLNFVVRASDSGTPVRHTDVTVTLSVDDVNDNAPEFEKNYYEFEISAESSSGHFVGKVLASDPDASDLNKLVYSLRYSTSNNLLDIDSRTGVVTLSEHAGLGAVDSPLSTNVSVSDGMFTASVGFVLRITSRDTSPVPLVFDENLYNFTITENQPSGTKLGKISATGVGHLTYEMASETEVSDLFQIDATSGKLLTAAVIDRESLQESSRKAVVNFRIRATDSQGFITHCSVNVKVLDENDNSPIFHEDSYAAVLVPNESEISDQVITLSADDADFGENGRVSFTWEEDQSNAKQFFSLDVDTGVIAVRERPWRKGNVDVLSFYIRAYDHGADPRSSLVAVSVYLASDPTSVPRFSDDHSLVSVPENALVGSEVTTVRASAGRNKIVYSIADPYVTDDIDYDVSTGSMKHDRAANSSHSDITIPFAIDGRSGRITTIRDLDRERQAVHVITVLARVDTTPDLVASAQVKVTALDVNDNRPQFTSSQYHASVVENSPKGVELVQVEAHDIDEGAFGTVSYSLVKSKDNSHQLFTINAKTGIIKTTAPLDREARYRYTLQVRAADGGNRKNDANKRRTSTSHVIVDVIDVNDNPPTFDQQEYSLSLKESASVGQLTSKFMRVSDNDTATASNLRLYITDGDPRGQFEVFWDQPAPEEATLASLKLAKPLDRETKATYELNVVATDGLHTSQAVVRVSVGDVNDNPPVCEQLWYHGKVREDAASRTFILRVLSTDRDAGAYGRITHLLTGKGSKYFDLEARTGELFTSLPLDREDTGEYWLTATSSDGRGRNCISQIHIVVEDVNDNAPVFEQASLRSAARENTPVHSLLHRVVANDGDLGENGTVFFSLADDVNGQFYIEPETGVVILQKPLDRETVPSYQLQIQAQDKGSEKRLSSSGLLRLQVLDVNDNPPIFDRTQYEALLMENARTGRRIGQVAAKSLDTGANANLRYRITHGNEHGKFAIHRDSGVVTLLSPVDYESDQSYVLTISASDRSENPLTSECTMLVNILDVNDNAPEFASDSYQISVPEDAETDRLVIVLSASDKDSGSAGNVTYSLSSKNVPNVPFRINSISGKLFVASPGLDHEMQESFELIVVASDSGNPHLSTEAFVHITVTDVNDNRPQCVVSAPTDDENARIQNSPGGANSTVYVHESASDSVVQGIAMLNATDADGKGNAGPFTFRIISGNDADLFYLDSNNILKSRRPLKLNDVALTDRARNSQRLVHRLKIEVRDSGSPIFLVSDPPLHLNVVVLKESQYAPELTPHHVQITIPEDEFSGDLITQRLHATDRDEFDQDRLRFSLASPEDFERYVVDPISGAVTAMAPLRIGTHNISVRVSDGSRFSFSTVSITVSQLSKEALENSVSVAFRGIRDTEEYLSLYHTLFVDELRNVLPDRFKRNRDLMVLSLQSTHDVVQILFAVRIPPSDKVARKFYLSKALKGILDKSRTLIEEKLRVQVETVEGTLCPAEDCEFGNCRQIPKLDEHSSGDNSAQPVTTSSYSLLTSSFGREQTCVCRPGTTGEFCESICASSNNPCTSEFECRLDDAEEGGYRCDPPAKANTVMAFSGRGFAQYEFTDAEKSTPFQISLRLRTFQSNATIFYASGTRHFARLETTSGVLRFTFDSGNGPQVMVQNLKLINEGHWHDLNLELLQDRASGLFAFKLTLNGKYSAKTSAGREALKVNGITFGGMPSSGKSKRSSHGDRQKRSVPTGLVIRQGFRGCLEDVTVNNMPLPSQPSATGIRLESVLGVSKTCETEGIDMEACAHSPCMNGGICLPLPDGSHQCDCPLNYDGERCETFDPCGPLPCKNNGYCLSDGEHIKCRCTGDFTGPRCETSSVCRAVDQCRNGGTCVAAGGSKVSCRCRSGWSGRICEVDIDECQASPAARRRCGGVSNCFNYNGGYACNCTATGSLYDPKCQFVSDLRNSPQSVTSESSIMIIVVACVVIVMIVIIAMGVVCWRKRRNGNGYRSGSRASKDITPMGNFNPNNYNQHPIPPIPERPADYQRSSRDSYQLVSSNLDEMEQRMPPVGYVRPQLPLGFPSMSAASDNDSIRKPPPSWPDYDPSKYNQSASSSVHHLPSSRKISCSSINDQQSFHWDDSDWRRGGPGMESPAMAGLPYGRRCRRGTSDVPSSPESRRSINSTSTCRSRRSHRSDALPGFYNSGRRRREKQLLQMVALNKAKNESDNFQLQQMLSQLVSQGIPESVYSDRDSRNSSIRSSSSRYKSSLRRKEPLPPVPPNPVSPIVSRSVDSYADSFADNELGNDEHIEKFKSVSPSACVTGSEREISSSDRPSDSDSAPRSSGSELPPPPTDGELQALREEDDERLLDSSQLPPATSNRSYSSLLARPFDPEVPTPATARSTRFHPDQYLINHRSNASDMSLASDSVPGSNYSLDLPYGDPLHRRGNLPSYETPRPPDRYDSERLAMSSLSEAEEEDELVDEQSHLQKHRHIPLGHPPIDNEPRTKRMKKHAAPRNSRRRNDPHCDQEMQLLSPDTGASNMYSTDKYSDVTDV